MNRRFAAVLVALYIVTGVTPVLAWEFHLQGEYEYRFRYFARTGPIDLFGNAAMQNSIGTFIGFAGPNIYGTGNLAAVPGDSANSINKGLFSIYGLPTLTVPVASSYRITRGGFSRWGSDAKYNDSRMTLRPMIEINQAVRAYGTYTIGGMRNKYKQNNVVDWTSDPQPNVSPRGMVGSFGLGAAPLERYYMSQTSMNAHDGTFGTWEQFRLTARMPWGIWSIGVKDFPFGTGATLAENTRGEHFLWVVPYGPFRFISATWFGRGRFLESWNTVPDGDTKTTWFEGLGLTYDSGGLSLGSLTILRNYHQNVGALPVVANADWVSLPRGLLGVNYYNSTSSSLFGIGSSQVPESQPALDETTLISVAYFKFNNGRFFANAEYSWANLNTTFPANVPPSTMGTPGPSPVYVEAYHVFSEAGIIGGPAKLSLMFAQASGPVLNNPNPTKVYGAYPINYQAMEPYEFLMFNTYGGGNSGGWNATDVTFVSDDHGMLSDGYCYAGRLDYAVAANLNVYGSYIWAHRLERAGFFNGQVIDTGHGSQSWNSFGGSTRVPAGTFLNQYGGTTPYCPDGFLGWEANVGTDWKLLEGLTFMARYSYWKPGQWFDYAYQAWGWGTVFGVAGPTDGVVVRDRSAINAFQLSVLAAF